MTFTITKRNIVGVVLCCLLYIGIFTIAKMLQPDLSIWVAVLLVFSGIAGGWIGNKMDPPKDKEE